MASEAEQLLHEVTRALRCATSDEERIAVHRDGSKSLMAALNDGMASGDVSQAEATRLWLAWTDEAQRALPDIEPVRMSAGSSQTAIAERDD